MQNRVLRQRLQHHFGNHARKQLLRHILLKRKAVRQPDALNLHIPSQNFQLPPQLHKFVRRDAEAQNIRQIRRHQRHLRHLIDLADPLHRIQRIAQKVWIQLRLHHPDLRVVECLLVLKQRLLVAPQRQNHPVKLLRQFSQLVVLPILHRHLHLQIVFSDLCNRVVQRTDRLEHLPAQLQAQKNTHRHAAERAQGADRIQKPQRPARKHLRLLQHKIQPRCPTLPRGV